MLGLRESGRSRTYRERHEGLRFDELALVIEEVVRVEFVRKFPLSLLAQHRVQVLDDQCALWKTRGTTVRAPRETGGRRSAFIYLF